MLTEQDHAAIDAHYRSENAVTKDCALGDQSLSSDYFKQAYEQVLARVAALEKEIRKVEQEAFESNKIAVALKRDLENAHQQDRLKTLEINILVLENRQLRAKAEALEAKIEELEAKSVALENSLNQTADVLDAAMCQRQILETKIAKAQEHLFQCSDFLMQ